MSKFEENEELNEIYNGEEQFDDIEIITEDEEYENNDIEILTEDEEKKIVGGTAAESGGIAGGGSGGTVLKKGKTVSFYASSYTWRLR